jgi:hypothetical protein
VHHHAAYYGHAAHAASSGGWFTHMLVWGFVHNAIDHLMAPIFRAAGPVGLIVLAVAVIFIGYKIVNRA